MADKDVSMVQECVSAYFANKHPNGSLTITIEVPARFADLWLIKLSELKATADDLRGSTLSE